MTTVQERPIGMSIQEAAAEAGVSESTLYALANRNKLPGARRVGKRIVIHRLTFEEWLRTGQGS
jgi:excisionase family DNA binding protein